MMKVYQPVCPDMKFRLVADLSPDAVEVSEDSTISSDSASCMSDDDDAKVTTTHDNNAAATPHPPLYPCSSRVSPSSSAVSAVPVTGSAQACPQHPACTPVPGSVHQRSELSSASTQPFALSGELLESNAHASGGDDCVDNCRDRMCRQNVTSHVSCSAPRGSCMAQHSMPAQDEDEEHSMANERINNFSVADCAAPCSLQQPVCFNEKICDSINPHAQDVADLYRNSDACDEDESDDDNASIEDISISHNVPMCPPSPAPFSPARTPPVRGAGMAERGVGGVCRSSSRRERSVESRTSGLHLDVNTQSNRHGSSPYTLACAITPSPLHEHTTMAATLTSATDAASSDLDLDPASTDAVSHASGTESGGLVTETWTIKQVSVDASEDQEGDASASSAMNRSIYDEIQEALIREVSGEDPLHDPPLTSDLADPAQQYPFIHKHMGHLFDKKRLLIGYASSSGPVRHRDMSTSPCRSGYSSAGRSRHVSAASMASEAATSVEENVYKVEDLPAVDWEEEVIRVSLDNDEPDGAASAATLFYGQKRRRKNSDGDGSRRHSSSTMGTLYSDLEVTHRGMHRFIPRHADEVQVGIGDPIHVIKEFDDLWCEGVNLRSGERGIFPAMYANDLTFLEDSEEEDEHWKFTMRFLGTVEVTSASGDIALCQAINKVAQQGRIKTASLCILEINQYGIRMIDKSKEGHESHKFSNFFALKNISFCGTHPNNNRYFAFITKHPREVRFACHVFHSERSTHRARDALGKAFKRFYQEYMAFTHPTEDIWIE